jgi:hypothetical protein
MPNNMSNAIVIIFLDERTPQPNRRKEEWNERMEDS